MAKSKNTWQFVAKPTIIPGTSIRCAVKRCDQTGEYGVSVGDGTSRDKWIALSSLDASAVRPDLEGKLRRAESEVQTCLDLLSQAEAIADIVGATAKRLRPVAPQLDNSKAITAARAALAKADGSLPDANDSAVVALAESFMRGFSQTAVAK